MLTKSALRHIPRLLLPTRTRALLKQQIYKVQSRLGLNTSQHAETKTLRQLIKPEFPTYLVDVGAYDGVVYSNSYPFVQQGWNAVLIEPHPLAYNLLAEGYRDNPRVVCVNRAIANVKAELPFHLGKEGSISMTSTLSEDNNPLLNARRSGHTITVQVEPLTDVLAAQGFPSDFSLLLIDTEAMDYDVLRGLDFERFRPRIIMTEEYILNLEKHEAKYRLLLDSGYLLYGMIDCNAIWIHKAWMKRCTD
jgi:FkbM family methyltransferase